VGQLGLGPGACHQDEGNGSEAGCDCCGLDDVDSAIHVMPPGIWVWLVGVSIILYLGAGYTSADLATTILILPELPGSDNSIG